MNDRFKNLIKDLVVLDTLNIKPNYAQLARYYNCDWRTIKKYHNGYEGKSTTRNKSSKLDKYKNIITDKLQLPGITISAIYQYLLDLEPNLCSYSNLFSYVKKHDLLPNKVISSVPPSQLSVFIFI